VGRRNHWSERSAQHGSCAALALPSRVAPSFLGKDRKGLSSYPDRYNLPRNRRALWIARRTKTIEPSDRYGANGRTNVLPSPRKKSPAPQSSRGASRRCGPTRYSSDIQANRRYSSRRANADRYANAGRPMGPCRGLRIRYVSKSSGNSYLASKRAGGGDLAPRRVRAQSAAADGARARNRLNDCTRY